MSTRRFPLAFPLTCLALLLSVSGSWAEATRDTPRLVRVTLGGGFTVQRLADAGLDVIQAKGDHAMLLTTLDDEAKLGALGATFELVDPTPGVTRAARSRAELAARPAAPGTRVTTTPGLSGTSRVAVLPPFGSGSMGGYWNRDEVILKLEELIANDTQNVVADTVDTLGFSIQGRAIHALELGKAWPGPGPDPRPVVYFHSLIHSREPEGMQALFYFVDDLLAKYGTDPVATHLLDHRRIVICPIVNPDGYQRNWTTYSNSGGTTFGYWRKNLRDNDANLVIDGNDGVDLNRNFPYQWGLSSGSSGTFSDETYRGSSAGSEVETQAQMNAVIALKPTTGFALHTFSDLYLHAWGYTPAPTADSLWFFQVDDELSAKNGYQAGQSPRVLYTVSGEYNDWVYGETGTKPRGYTWTPEIGDGDDDFWPAPSSIVPLARENLHAFYTMAEIAGAGFRAEDVTTPQTYLNAGYFANLMVSVRNLGLAGAPDLTGTLTSLSAGANVLRATASYPGPAANSLVSPLTGEFFTVTADDTVTAGRVLRFQLDLTSSDGTAARDTIELVCGTPTQVFFDNATSGTALWTTTSWGTVNGDFQRPDNPYFTESPLGLYGNNINSSMRITGLQNFLGGVHAYAFHLTRWHFEVGWDGARFEASLNGTNWFPLPSTAATYGKGIAGGTTLTGEPVMTGTRYFWRPDRTDLSAYAGTGNVGFRVRATADAAARFDGMALDDVQLVVYVSASQPIPTAVGDGPTPTRVEFAAPWPNPARELVRFEFALPREGLARLEVFDLGGRRVRQLTDGNRAAGRWTQGWDLADDGGRRVGAGVYLARLTTDAGVQVRRIALLR